jgi:hypothetical protein
MQANYERVNKKAHPKTITGTTTAQKSGQKSLKDTSFSNACRFRSCIPCEYLLVVLRPWERACTFADAPSGQANLSVWAWVVELKTTTARSTNSIREKERCEVMFSLMRQAQNEIGNFLSYVSNPRGNHMVNLCECYHRSARVVNNYDYFITVSPAALKTEIKPPVIEVNQITTKWVNAMLSANREKQ